MKKDRIVFDGSKSFLDSCHTLHVSIIEHTKYGVLEVSAYEDNFNAQALLLYIDVAMLRLNLTNMVENFDGLGQNVVSFSPTQESDRKIINYILRKTHVNTKAWDGSSSMIVSVQFGDCHDSDDADLLVDRPEGLVQWMPVHNAGSSGMVRSGNKLTWCHSTSVISALIHSHAFLEVIKPLNEEISYKDTTDTRFTTTSEVPYYHVLSHSTTQSGLPIASALAADKESGSSSGDRQHTESGDKPRGEQLIDLTPASSPSPRGYVSIVKERASMTAVVEFLRSAWMRLLFRRTSSKVVPMPRKLKEGAVHTLSGRSKMGPFSVLVKGKLEREQTTHKRANIEIADEIGTERGSTRRFKPDLNSIKRRSLGELLLGSQRVTPGR